MTISLSKMYKLSIWREFIVKICLVCSKGGHLEQMVQLLDAFNGHDIFIVTHKSDIDSDIRSYFVRSSKGKIVSRITMLYTFVEAIKILLKECPDIIVSTGSGVIAVPFCYMGKILGMKILYIESLARIKTPSAGGKFVYPIADLFLVQWQSLLKAYGKKAKYWGNII
jgi:beta-1,4-N-acetylglucosaminyltransferase